MSEKKKDDKVPALNTGKKGKPYKPKRVRKHPSELVVRDDQGNKVMKVARGTERARRRVGIKRGWRNVKNAQPMQPTKAELAAMALQGNYEVASANHDALSKQKAA